jgi:hypothetical protein
VICRPGCGACCIALSITSPLPGMPGGKPAGVVCANLDPDDLRCRIWGSEDYPPVCRKFLPARDVCGETREEAIRLIDVLEQATVCR